jgi:hypothetical protein
MPLIAGFDKLESLAEEQITDRIRRRVISGRQGTMVYWTIKAGGMPPLTSILMSSLCG